MSDTSTADLLAIDPLITDTAKRLFEEFCTHEVVQAAEATGSAPELWQTFNDVGFAHISIPEERGGSGGTLQDALEVLRLVGYYAAPIPAAETSLLGGWLLSQASLELPDGTLAVPTQPGNTEVVATNGSLPITATEAPAQTPIEVQLNGSLTGVPWASSVARIVFLAGGTAGASPATKGSAGASPTDSDSSQTFGLVVSVDPQDALITPLRNMAGEPRDRVVFENTSAIAAPAPPGVNQHSLRLRGALSRAALMAGALRKMAQLTVTYTNEREQFGRPVARFQAVQQHLVWAAQDAALLEINAQCAGLAAHRAANSVAGITGAEFEIAAVKLIANQAAARATKACHQAHGAMGMTQEYPLHHLSRRLWSWRMEYGGEAEWSKVLGAATVSQGADRLYPLITSGKPAAKH